MKSSYGTIDYGEAVQAFNRWSSYQAWKFPGEIDETAPYWIQKEVENKKLIKDGDTYKYRKLKIEKGYVFLYNYILRSITVSDANIFNSKYFVCDIPEDLKEVNKDDPIKEEESLHGSRKSKKSTM